MKLRYVGSSDEVDIPSLGLSVKRGGTVEVSAEAAGRPYSEEKGENGETVVDLGAGLLAQHDNWEPVEKTAPKKAASSGAATDSQEG